LPTKTQSHIFLKEKAAEKLVQNLENWIKFLETSSRMYKYSFAEQLMIHAQRPDAAACASYDAWGRLNRYVRRGAKGIALIDEDSPSPRLKYVFDLSDTGSRGGPPPYIWKLEDEHKADVMEMLSKNYGERSENLENCLRKLAENMAGQYYEDNKHEISYSFEDSYLEDFDEAAQKKYFCAALTASLAYGIFSRCGLDASGFNKEDFTLLREFSTIESLSALGTAVNELSGEVLRDIERTVKQHEREKLRK
jgi:hypothetical protein